MTDPPEHNDIHVRLPLAYAHQAGLLVQPVDTGDLFSELQDALFKTLARVRTKGQGSAPYNGHFLAHVTCRLRALKGR